MRGRRPEEEEEDGGIGEEALVGCVAGEDNGLRYAGQATVISARFGDFHR